MRLKYVPNSFEEVIKEVFKCDEWQFLGEVFMQSIKIRVQGKKVEMLFLGLFF